MPSHLSNFMWIPVTCPATVIGIPIAPNATGAVFAIKQRPRV